MLMACILAAATALALLVAPAAPAAAYPMSNFEWTLQQSGVDVELFWEVSTAVNAAGGGVIVERATYGDQRQED